MDYKNSGVDIEAGYKAGRRYLEVLAAFRVLST